MSLSNAIASMICDMLEEEGAAEFKRNSLAQNLGCAPSQINYVISSRFTPEKGFIVESRRGGGGSIRISRINYSGESLLMHIVNSVGSRLDEKDCRNHLMNLLYAKLISEHEAKMIAAATADSVLKGVEAQERDTVRAAIFKQILLAAAQK